MRLAPDRFGIPVQSLAGCAVIRLAISLTGIWLAIGSTSGITAADVSPHHVRLQAALQRAVQAHQAAGDQAVASDWIRLGDAQLRSGQVDDAIESFEQAIQLELRSKPYLWQYGIALFFANRLDDGRRLFEQHRQVNPNDVENAAWHFLCVAKSKSLAEARRMLLPAPDDARTPMQEVLERLKGGDDKDILHAIDAATVDRPSARFYGQLYLGLIADAEGHRAAASEHLNAAASTSATHYMADVARLYAERIAADQGDTAKANRLD